MPPPHSAGVLLFRQREGATQVLLIKPGGPFWKNKDSGAWMIPKGEVECGEAPAAAALREFEEETGTRLTAVPFPLANRYQSAWRYLEWPPRSGRRQRFPECEQARWMSLAEARAMMLPSQLPLLDALEAKLNG